MGLLRLTFWLALIVAILPTDKDRQAQVISAFSSGTTWVLTFCDRNGETCKKGSEAWQVFKTKAEFGGRLVATFVFAVIAAVSVSGPLERLSRQPGRMHAPAVLAAAERLSESLRRAAEE